MKIGFRTKLISAGLGAAALALLTAQQPQAAAVFTAAQAQAGRGVYDQNCAGCHGANFQGSGDAPALAGGTFLLQWRTRMVSELFGDIIQKMPPTSAGSLGEAAGLNVTAYILQRNGAQPGTQALTPGAAMQIGSVATGPAQQTNAAPAHLPQDAVGQLRSSSTRTPVNPPRAASALRVK